MARLRDANEAAQFQVSQLEEQLRTLKAEQSAAGLGGGGSGAGSNGLRVREMAWRRHALTAAQASNAAQIAYDIDKTVLERDEALASLERATNELLSALCAVALRADRSRPGRRPKANWTRKRRRWKS